MPYLAAILVTKFAEWGFDIDPGDAQALVVTGIGTVWYVAARVAEQHWPNAGWLLGSPKQPTYLAAGEQP